MNKSQAVTIYVLIASVLAVTAVMALLTTQKTLPGTGTIQTVGVGVYTDQNCNNAATSLDAGPVAPGSSKNFTLYLRNEGNSVLTLDMTTNSWTPATAPNYITLTWNRQGQKINPNQVVVVMIALSVSQSVQGIGSFTFNAVITGTA